MTKHGRVSMVLVAGLALLLAGASMAQAQATRTWVSGVGDDANPCSRTAPCKTFAGAISKTAPGGEIDVLDPGGFGALTITKSISIEADGVIAGVLVSGTNAFVISAPAGSQVTLRGITFEGLGTGLNGVRILSAGEVDIEGCYFNNFVQQAIDIEPTATSASNADVFIKDTFIQNEQGTSPNGFGVLAAPGANVSLDVVLDNVRMGNTNGFRIQGGRGTIRNSSLTNSRANGVTVVGGTLSLDNTLVFGSANDGVIATNSGAVATLTNCSILNNGAFGVVQSAGTTINTFGNNRIFGNTSGAVSGGPLTSIGQQ